MAKIPFEIDVNCPGCHSPDIIKASKRNGWHRYECKSCGKWFRNRVQLENAADGRKYSDEVVGAALHQYFSGMSIRNIARNIQFREGLPRPSTDTVFQWIKDYIETATYATRDLKAQTGDEWVADELVAKIDGRNFYIWSILDKDSRYLIATHASESRSAEEAIQVVKKAIARASHPPKRFRSDKYAAYPVALRYLMPYTKHIKTAGVNAWVNNNLSERMQNTFREKEKTMRGMYTVETAQQYFDGFAFNYNHLRDHMALKGKTPGEVAGMAIPFREWADVVRANIEVPAEWKRETKRRTPRKKNHGHTEKGYRKRPQKGREEPVRGIQLGMDRHKKPTEKDRERVNAYWETSEGREMVEMMKKMDRMERKPPPPECNTQRKLMTEPCLPRPEIRKHRAEAPRAAMPDAWHRTQPRPRPHGLQREMFERQMRPIPARMRPRPAGGRR